MEIVDIDEIRESFPYLNQPDITLESAIRNEGTLCITLSLKVGKLIDIVDTYGWQCIFDRGVGEDTEVFTCIARREG
ncbi:hypothetical protein BREVNS_1539 [Brevinematales bacterium NS]|nr:hypothetical protein [Brevinematales bacterium]QJR22289.1 hypothetical protein BREVNS_1539 [Brevinematales bacterium NS]